MHSFHRYYLFVWVFLIHFLLTFAIRNESVLCKETERQALLNIKLHLIDDYGDLSSWGSEEHKRDCCKWNGITCSNLTGHVTELTLFYMRGKMRGKMSASLLELTHLTSLVLPGIDFGGTQFPIHSKNASLTKLINLDLYDSNFGGRISSFLSNLSRLQALDLRRNHFTDIGNSYWISGLSSLTFLDLYGIPLMQPNDWLEIVSNKLLHLEFLRLDSCFSGDQVHNLTLSPINSSSALTRISLSNNNLLIPSIHPWLSNISHNIQHIDLSSNILMSANFDNMFSLEYLDLSNTTLVGSIPLYFRNMSQLSVLRLSHNKLNTQLSELIRSISDKSLWVLDLGYCEISGSFPHGLTRFSSLLSLSLPSNKLNGVISQDHFSNLSNLEDLDLSHNSFIWNVSRDWAPPFNLWDINLADCKIGPHFPKWLQTQNYQSLDISNTGISDSIPDWFWNHSFSIPDWVWNNSFSVPIRYLNLSCNDITGEVRSFWMMSFDEAIVDLSFNHLVGSLPFTQFFPIQSFSSYFRLIDLSNNLFSGVIPISFMNFTSLLALNLANNNLYGKIPPSIGYLPDIQTLNLGSNKLSGHLPFSLGKCTKLKFLDLSNNKLSGNIPTWIGKNLSSLQYLSLQSNQFYGIMPLQLCQLKAIQILDLSINSINGTILPCLNNFKSMVDQSSNGTIYNAYEYPSPDGPTSHNYMDKGDVLWKGLNYKLDKNLGRFRIINLSHNKLEGEIPKEISILRSLQQLNLSNNILSGPIPKEIDGLKQLESLDLSWNHLSGKLPATMSNLNFLSILNISHNNFSGRIPLSTQLQSFNPSAFSDNPLLCGLPLPHKCSEDNIQEAQPNHDRRDDKEDEFMRMVYIGMGVGFIISFWGVSGTLLLKRSCRHAFFMLLDGWEDCLYVRIILFKRKLLKIKELLVCGKR